MSIDDIDAVDFELYLLDSMKPPVDLLSQTLKRLGQTKGEMEERCGKVSQIMRQFANAADSFRSILRENLLAEWSRIQQGIYLYHLPLWWEFAFELSLDSSGRYIENMRFQKHPARGLAGESVAPWKFLEVDLAASFDQIREGDSWGHYKSYLARDRKSDKWHFLRFGWGLLQEVKELTPGEMWRNGLLS
ncbi:hypothetical protein FNH05_08950 [Amycolatopsis rhizosphaerae]|uniref:Uncharacterized protein n=1 Tax=Amycolatopsis rhizosphaerae TaxID=2053003 RepID=A0A558D4B2_9PSEU|nr:hypothetical protein [Amycolatopsis rhizosphaerae]TVT55836.1 hypothetical protein FNH05_08950 [Amycolatopsis rhizosphaerae]